MYWHCFCHTDTYSCQFQTTNKSGEYKSLSCFFSLFFFIFSLNNILVFTKKSSKIFYCFFLWKLRCYSTKKWKKTKKKNRKEICTHPICSLFETDMNRYRYDKSNVNTSRKQIILVSSFLLFLIFFYFGFVYLLGRRDGKAVIQGHSFH